MRDPNPNQQNHYFITLSSDGLSAPIPTESGTKREAAAQGRRS